MKTMAASWPLRTPMALLHVRLGQPHHIFAATHAHRNASQLSRAKSIQNLTIREAQQLRHTSSTYAIPQKPPFTIYEIGMVLSLTKTHCCRVQEREYLIDPSDVSDDIRYPRAIHALHLKPLRRVAEYGVPSCDLQLRSYSLRPLEFFADFALRAAYYLNLPAYGPVPLPRITERWTVPKSTFIFKKAQENFERVTARRLIQIRDGNPESVQIWLAFLQKHAYYGVGMKANLWEFSKLGSFANALSYLSSSSRANPHFAKQLGYRWMLLMRTCQPRSSPRSSIWARTDL
jgi:small subunit ribosomal protein S10